MQTSGRVVPHGTGRPGASLEAVHTTVLIQRSSLDLKLPCLALPERGLWTPLPLGKALASDALRRVCHDCPPRGQPLLTVCDLPVLPARSRSRPPPSRTNPKLTKRTHWPTESVWTQGCLGRWATQAGLERVFVAVSSWP